MVQIYWMHVRPVRPPAGAPGWDVGLASFGRGFNSQPQSFLRQVTIFHGLTIFGYNHHPGELNSVLHWVAKLSISVGCKAGK